MATECGASAIFFELVRLTAELAGVRVLRNTSTPMARRGIPFPEKRPRRAEIVTGAMRPFSSAAPLHFFFFLIVVPHVFDVFASPHVLVKHPFFVHTFVCIYQKRSVSPPPSNSPPVCARSCSTNSSSGGPCGAFSPDFSKLPTRDKWWTGGLRA